MDADNVLFSGKNLSVTQHRLIAENKQNSIVELKSENHQMTLALLN